MPRITLIVTVGLAILALAAPAATATAIRDRVGATAAPQQDQRNPDNRVVGSCSSGRSCETGEPAQDLRSPDASDAAAGRATSDDPDVISPQVFTDRQRAIVERFKRSPSYQQAVLEAATFVKPPQSAPAASDDGIDWGDAGIGAASLLGVIALGVAGAMTILHRRRRGRQTATVA